MKMPGRCTGPKLFSKSLGKWRRRHLGGHDFVRRMDREGEVFKWRRKCSGYARQRMEPKLVNCGGPDRKSPSQRGKELENRGRKEELRERDFRGC